MTDYSGGQCGTLYYEFTPLVCNCENDPDEFIDFDPATLTVTFRPSSDICTFKIDFGAGYSESDLFAVENLEFTSLGVDE